MDLNLLLEMEAKSLDLPTTKTYISRWWVLCMVSMSNGIQNCIWAGWGPIGQSAKAVYGWDDTVIYMMTVAGNLAYIVVVLPAAWLLDVKGKDNYIIDCGVTLL